MALTKIETQNIEDGAISTPKLGAEVAASVTLIQSVADAANLIPAITSVNVANSTYTVLDDTAVSLDGGYIVINGTGFSTGAQVLIDGTVATSVTRVSSTQLQVQVPAKTAASYNLYVVNNTGHTAIKVNGLTYSGTPTWVTGSTLDPQAVDVAFSVAFNATGATSYANTTALPAGTALLSNGYFYGTVTGIAEETVYNFTVMATDAENQDSPREFSVTVTVGPPPGTFWAWGLDGYDSYFLPLNSRNVMRSSPVQVGLDGDWQLIDSGMHSALAIKSNGTLWGWGSNEYGGLLGLNEPNTAFRSSPTQIGSLTNWSSISCGRYHVAAIKTDGTLWAWGTNIQGALGVNDTVNRSSPTQVGTNTDWSKVTCGFAFTASITSSGALYTWGDGGSGKLGLSSTQSKSSPTQVGSLTNWSSVSAASTQYWTTAIKTDGTLWVWGANNEGQLGLNDMVYKSSPTQVGTLTNWSSVGKIQEVNLYALKTDGTLWAWGNNAQGNIGLNDVNIHRSSPVQIGSDTNWTKANSGERFGMFLKTNGTLWMVGNNSYGQLGFNDRIKRSSPVQLGTDTNWMDTAPGAYQAYALKSV
jgi:alpha-tubulin suppressor-like RCC1 family protein